MVPLKDLEEARLGSSRSLHATEGKSAAAIVDVLDVEHQVLHPERSAFTDSGELRRLKVRVSQCRLISPLLGERRERPNYVERATANQVQSTTHQDEIRIVSDVGAGGTQMDERLCLGCDISKSVHVRHHVVAKALLVLGHRVEVDVVEVRLHLANRLFGNRYAQLTLRFGEREPQSTPQAVTGCRRPKLKHRRRRISLSERRAIPVCHHYCR